MQIFRLSGPHHGKSQKSNIYDKGERLGKDSWYYQSNLKKIGITYSVQGDPKSPASTLSINISKFIERSKKMQELIKSGEENMAKVFVNAPYF